MIDGTRSERSVHEVGTDVVPETITADETDALLDSWLIAGALATITPEHRTVIVHAHFGGRSSLY